MSHNKQKRKCRICGTSKGHISQKRLCSSCAITRIRKNVKQMQEKHGIFYNRWLRSLKASINRQLTKETEEHIPLDTYIKETKQNDE